MQALNNDIDNLLVLSPDNQLTGKVCLVCDKILVPKDIKHVKWSKFVSYKQFFKNDSLPDELRAQYHYIDPTSESRTNSLEGCLLSPRSVFQFGKTDKKKEKPTILLCTTCAASLKPSRMDNFKLPLFAIANSMAVGKAPLVLSRLNEIEVALLSQARFRGHLFTYWGGCHRSIRGWHSFYDVDVGHTTAVLQDVRKLTDSNNIAVVLCGPFTSAQKTRIMKKIRVNIPWILEAFEWLQTNNELYKDMPTPQIGQPRIIDTSTEVESENTDIETKEELSVVFPDGTVHTGGCKNGAEFDLMVAEIKARAPPGAQPIITSRPSSRVVKDYAGDNLLRAFPLQFPYGLGGGSREARKDPKRYYRQLLSMSIPAFHESCFVLCVHNMYEKNRALSGKHLNIAVLNPSSSHVNHDLTVVCVRSYLAGDGCKGKV